jgi:uncharacterized protein YbjT (DUF2867 family)
MNVLVLGGYGFIGEAVCRALNEAGHDVVGLGRDIARAEHRMPFVRWLRADLRYLQTPAAWAPLITGIDASSTPPARYRTAAATTSRPCRPRP